MIANGKRIRTNNNSTSDLTNTLLMTPHSLSRINTQVEVRSSHTSVAASQALGFKCLLASAIRHGPAHHLLCFPFASPCPPRCAARTKSSSPERKSLKYQAEAHPCARRVNAHPSPRSPMTPDKRSPPCTMLLAGVHTSSSRHPCRGPQGACHGRSSRCPCAAAAAVSPSSAPPHALPGLRHLDDGRVDLSGAALVAVAARGAREL